ncbi:MAG: hypothetical protein AB1758_13820 [Candidatus Eremiobacterota bacterium]
MRMVSIGLLLLALFAVTGAQQQEVPVPRPISNGDYWIRNENGWLEWEVVVKELPGRLHPQWPPDWRELGASLPARWDIWRWPAVVMFPKGLVMKAAMDSEGGCIVKDENGDSWLRVFSDETTGDICFVRANKKYIRPYRPR